MQSRARAGYGAVLLALAVLMAVFVPEARGELVSALAIGLFGLGGALFLTSGVGPAGIDPHLLAGTGQASLAAGIFGLFVVPEVGTSPDLVFVILGSVVLVAGVWRAVRLVRHEADPGF
ncbi:hypothetical protein [Haloarchaeobius amylolyticus]|uniref:hypothetical protein n=1 Tax=Haloarchaeobius amylolyticus TaxID=1198296 RepID=UPI00226E4A03|nr:hypothetical protein [Haloarchaeobius amylolyticus]